MPCPTAVGTPMLLVALGLALGDAPAPSPSPEERAEYREAADAAGRDPDAQVRLALWCGANGLPAEARRHLALAVLIDPDHDAARALLGQVRLGDDWLKPDEVARRGAADPALREEYEGRRSRLDPTADAHWRLALWCEQNGMEDEATAHLSAVTRLDPGRESAWKRLGFKKHDGRWMTPEQIAAAKADAEAQEEANEHWLPLLTGWRGQLSDPEHRAEADRSLASVDDPRAVRAAWRVFANEATADQSWLVQILGQIDAPNASRGLAMLAASSPHAEARRLATETLRRRDPREWAGPLVGAIREPIKYEVRPVGGPGSPGVLYVEGEEFDTRRVYEVRARRPFRAPMPGEVAAVGPDGRPYSFAPLIAFGQSNVDATALATRLAEDPKNAPAILRDLVAGGGGAGQVSAAQSLLSQGILPVAGDPFGGWAATAALVRNRDPALRDYFLLQRETLNAQQRLRADVEFIEATNAAIASTNKQVLPVLQQATAAGLGDDRAGWRDWYLNQVGLQEHRRRDTARRPVVTQRLVFGNITSSCFGAGTPVWTDRGTVPIEQVRLGDLVLSQDPRSGSLTYRPVVATHHNPPSKTFDVRIDGETIVTSPFHRLWVAGRGWVMARDLEVGDVLRAVGRTTEVEAIEEGQVQPVYNLDVADTRSFFVGGVGALVHDQTLPGPSLDPFDAVPDLAAMVEEADAGAGD